MPADVVGSSACAARAVSEAAAAAAAATDGGMCRMCVRCGIELICSVEERWRQNTQRQRPRLGPERPSSHKDLRKPRGPTHHLPRPPFELVVSRAAVPRRAPQAVEHPLIATFDDDIDRDRRIEVGFGSSL